MVLETGNYASAGQPLLTFINTDKLWLTAMVRENSLVHLKRGGWRQRGVGCLSWPGILGENQLHRLW
ncbi:hypothetical protein NMD70_08275 [Edwardsiella tarda]|uniref:hypothetical protein n=1 Tax=Edwardsiella tarda TaxID=636 RepID=UPI00351C89FF